MKLNAHKLVHRFGGPTTLQRRLDREGHDISVAGIHMWINRNAIPSRWFLVLTELAEKDGRPLRTKDMVGESTKQRTGGSRPRKANVSDDASFLE